MRWKRLIPHRHRWKTMKVRVDEDMTLETEEGALEFIDRDEAKEFNTQDYKVQMCEFCEKVLNGDFEASAKQLLKIMGVDVDTEEE